MEEKSLDQLNSHLEEVLEDVYQMTKDFMNTETFSHYSQFLSVLTPSGLLGAFREKTEQKKLRKFLETKIYRNMSFDEIGFNLIHIAKDLSETQAEIQKRVSKDDEKYYGNVELIIETLEKCMNSWQEISPKVAMEVLTLANGTEFQLGPQVEFEMQIEYAKMDLPPKYNRIKKSIKQAQNGSGCMIIIVIALTTFLSACSVL